MSFQNFWSNYKVLIVMLPLVGFIHLGWYRIKSSPVFQMPNKDNISAPDSPAFEYPEKNHTEEK